MRERILSRLRALGAEERLALVARLERELRVLERELAEVRQLIPAWSRIFFFLESADERREKELRALIASMRRDLETARGRLRADLDAVGAELPPFAAATLLEDALVRGEPHATRDASLVASLERLAAFVLATWAPGFDAEPLLEKLSSASFCREAASRHERTEADERLLHAPASADELLPLLAARLLASPYFAEQERASELTSKRNRLVEAHEAAAANVSLLEKLNPLRTSPSEQRANELARQLEATRDALRLSRVEGRRLLGECASAYAPLALHRAVLETLAVAVTEDRAEEPALGVGGVVISVPVDRARVLISASLGRLERAFRAAFPGVPLPAELATSLRASEGAATSERVAPPLEPLVGAFVSALARSEAPSVLERALAHARDRAAARRGHERLASRIPWTQKLAFWSESEEKDEKKALLERDRWHGDKERLERIKLVATAKEIGGVLAPFRLRDETLEALRDLDRISTDPGEHVAHLLPTVFGIDAALRSLASVRRLLEQTWELSGDEGDMLEAIAAAPAEDVAVAADERLVWKPLRRRELASLLAFRLERTGFLDVYRRVREIEERERSVTAEKDEVGARLSIWDRLNVFSKSPEKERNRELGRTLQRLGAELAASVERLRAHLDHALHVYPPAQLYYSLPAVERAIRRIHADCRPIWVTVKCQERVPGSGPSRPIHTMNESRGDESGGEFTHQAIDLPQGPLVVQIGRPVESERWVERERQELRYICFLVGKEEAQHALASWAARVVGSFGDLPSYQELLETWARSAAT